MGQIITLKNRLNVFLDYFLLTSIIALTGFEYFFRATELLFYIVGPISFLTFITRKNKITPQFFLFLVGFLIWSFFQVLYENSNISALTNFSIRLLIYYFVASSLGAYLGKRLINIIVVISVISLVFYAISTTSSAGYSLLRSLNVGESLGGGIGQEATSNPGVSLVIFYLSDNLFIRNPGPFWEPGMFAVFINIALALNLVASKKITSLRSLILIITSITTLSTTSIIATSLILLIISLFIRRDTWSIVLILIMSLSSGYFLESEYGIEKIKNEQARSDISSSRFGAMYFHLGLIKKNPIAGNGFQGVGIDAPESVSPNGLTNIIVFWGIPFALIFYIMYYYSFRRIAFCLIGSEGNKLTINTIMIFIAFLTVSFAQDITTRHFAYVVAMYVLIDKNKLRQFYQKQV